METKTDLERRTIDRFPKVGRGNFDYYHANVTDSSSQVVVEKRLNRFLKELQQGLREGSVITSQSSEIASAEEEESVWQQIKKELEDVGITADDFSANREFIVGWIKKAIQDGMFKELPVGRRSRIVSSIAASTDVGMNHFKIGDPIIITAVAPQDSISRPRSMVIQEEKIPVVSPQATQSNPQSNSKSFTNGRNQLPVAVKPQPRLLSRRARFMNKVANPLTKYDRDLADAAIHNRVDQVRALLKYADPTIPYKGSTAVQKAIEHSSTGVLQIFLEHGVHVDHEMRIEETGLVVATKSGKIDVIEILLDYGADVDLLSRKQGTALLLAVESSRDDIVRLLLARGAQSNLANRYGQTALQIAVSRNDLRSTLLLLEADAKVDLRDDRGRTALMRASAEGHTKMVTLLLSRGADPYMRDNLSLGALTYAARNGDIATCTELLSEGREFSAGRDTGVNPAEACQLDMALLLAARVTKPSVSTPSWRRDLANLLLSHGANINAGVGKQNTALHEAAAANSLPMITLFLAKGAEIDAVNQRGQTPLHLAARNGQTSALFMLIQKGADLAAADKEGRTTLHHAVLSKKPETVRALVGLSVGSRLVAGRKDKKGKTALELAEVEKVHPNILRVLQGRRWVEDDTGR